MGAFAIDEEEQKSLDEREEQEKATPPQRIAQVKAWFRKWLTRRPEFGQ